MKLRSEIRALRFNLIRFQEIKFDERRRKIICVDQGYFERCEEAEYGN